MSTLSNDILISFLSSVRFFADLRSDSLAKLASLIQLKTFVKGEKIISKGDVGRSMFVIYEGKVKVHDDKHLFGTLKSTDCFGEYALIDNESRSASVTAIDRTKVFELDRETFLELMANDDGFSTGILSVLIKRHRELDSTQEQLASSKIDMEVLNSKMRGLIEGAMDAIIMFDEAFRIVLTNPSADNILENDDTISRNVLHFFDEESAQLIESLIQEMGSDISNRHLSNYISVIGSEEGITTNEGTLSKSISNNNIFYTLILRNIEDKLIAENTINLLTKQTEYLEEEINELTSSYGIIANDIGMKNVVNLINQVAPTDATVLITGETGTGKELVARAIHKASLRNNKPLIRINCGAIPTNLIESELFGHKKGAFTGATDDRKGRFLLADKGTIFLDEIGELPLDLQPKLLRVIQEGEFEVVGSSETEKVDVRIIAATHRDLLKYSQTNKFREDLYYRLNVFPIHVPPLRARGNDIIVIAKDMINQFSKKLNKTKLKLSKEDESQLAAYPWPGNVRELQNLIERAVIVSKNGKINWNSIIPSSIDFDETHDPVNSTTILTSEELSKLEKENITKALKQTRWKVSGPGGAAELLGLVPTTLNSKIKALGIERPI